MKIYFAYRTGYLANHRFIKEFEAESILDFFQKHWQDLADDEQYKEVLGSEVYGLPISAYTDDSDEPQPLPKPNNLDELKTCLEETVYYEDLIIDEHCIQVLTDDDEIQLAWYFFDETYKNANMDKLALWFYDELPTQCNAENKANNSFYPMLVPEGCHQSDYFGKNAPIKSVNTWQVGKDNDECYFVSSAIYDSSNLEDMNVIHLNGTTIKNLIADLSGYNIDEDGDNYEWSGGRELLTLQKFADKFKSTDLQTLLEKLNQYPIYKGNIDLDDLENTDSIFKRHNPKLGKIKVSDHLVELSISYVGIFYDYYIIMDSCWINSHNDLAKSIIHFGRTWEI